MRIDQRKCAWICAALLCVCGGMFAEEQDVKQVPVTFSGGHETDPVDRGRPVILIAAALGVPPATFREAFSHVKPARAAQEPEPGQVRKNKAALMSALEPLGVNNDRLDTVSNYYRYNGSRGEMWKNVPAAATATVRNGVVTGITITNPGAGYSSPPKISVAGVKDFNAEAIVAYGTDLAKNGSIKEIKIAGQ